MCGGHYGSYMLNTVPPLKHPYPCLPVSLPVPLLLYNYLCYHLLRVRVRMRTLMIW